MKISQIKSPNTLPLLKTTTQHVVKKSHSLQTNPDYQLNNIIPSSSISFEGLYDPSKAEVNKINEALSAKAENKSGVNFFISPKLETALLNYIDTGNISEQDFNLLDKQKTRISNFYSLISNNVQITKENKAYTKGYLEELRSSMKVLEKTFKELGLNDKEINLFKHFAIKTSPIFYFMGFPDEVAHPTQVARKNAVGAFKMGASNTEILKSAFVGWLHDPKFDLKITWSNLATHPIIAGSIADKVLNEPEIEKDIAAYLNQDKSKIKNFKFGIKESLFTNNDSKFVLDFAILNKPPFPVTEAEKGLAQRIKNTEMLSNIAHQRFTAPSIGEKSSPIPKDTAAQIKKEHFDTGIRLIKKAEFSRACNSLKIPTETLNDVLNGNIQNSKLLEDLRNELEKQNAIIRVKTNALPLFCHHDEVTEAGKIPAKTLIISDPMLLSLHKILRGASLPGPFTSFLKSFNNNIDSLPKDAQCKGKAWKKEMLQSCLQAADELNNRSIKDYSNKTIEEIEELYLKESTWGEYSCFIKEYDSEKVDKLYDALRKHYELTAEKSEHMFKIDF